MGMTTTTRTLTTAALIETLSRLADQLHADRNRKLATVEGTVLAIVAERMQAASETAYFAALTSYRAIKGAHASVPAGCGIY